MTAAPLLHAQASIPAPASDVRDWFLSLKTHPERYQFATHAGFTFDHGDFGTVGARFHTKEHLFGLRLTLHFILSDIGDWHFTFTLRRPITGIWGTYRIVAESATTSHLHLEVGSNTAIGHVILSRRLVRAAAQKQIQAEVEHVQNSLFTIHHSLFTEA